MMRISQATVQDLPRLARCHRKAFAHALSSMMGQRYVEKMLEWYLVDARAFMFFVEDNGECLGYCGGLKHDGVTRVGSASSMIQHSFNKALLVFLYRPWLLVHPEFRSKYRLAARNVWKKIRKLFGKEKPMPVVIGETKPHAGLIVIGVDPAWQGKGLGSMLLKEFERQAELAGFRNLQLTVRSDNRQAIASYERNGWEITKTEGKSTAMEKQLI
jgi:ribosomal protein S18 acetylase RimI-like enzyme